MTSRRSLVLDPRLPRPRGSRSLPGPGGRALDHPLPGGDGPRPGRGRGPRRGRLRSSLPGGAAGADPHPLRVAGPSPRRSSTSAGLVSCCGERGLLGLAFHPQYASNGAFYVYYTNAGGDIVLARYLVSVGPQRGRCGLGRRPPDHPPPGTVEPQWRPAGLRPRRAALHGHGRWRRRRRPGRQRPEPRRAPRQGAAPGGGRGADVHGADGQPVRLHRPGRGRRSGPGACETRGASASTGGRGTC